MRTVLWVIYLVLYLICAIPEMLRCQYLQRKGDFAAARRITEGCVRKWARCMLKAAGVTVEVHGLENFDGRPSVIVSNHQSDWDIPLVLGYLDKPYGIVAKDVLAKIPGISQWMKLLDCVFIDRNDARQAIRAINDAGKRIPEGQSLIIFPEGTRSKGEEIGDFKPGAFKTAFKYNAPIVPVSIDGTYKIMEANNGRWIKPGHVILTVLPPVETDGLDRVQQKEMGGKIKDMILTARYESRKASSHPDFHNDKSKSTDDE